MARELRGRTIVGIMLILMGLLFFLQNYEPLQMLLPDFVYQWEFFFMLFGVLFFLLSNNKTVGIVFFAIGLFNLYSELWPLVFVFIGIYILFGRKSFGFIKGKHNQILDSDKNVNYFEAISIFGGGTKVFTSSNLKGGNIISIFGGSEVNLTGCKLAEGDNIVETVSIFGGTTIIVPKDWKVNTDVLPIFGGFSDKRIKDPNLTYDTSKTLLIKGVAIFGGGEVKSLF